MSLRLILTVLVGLFAISVFAYAVSQKGADRVTTHYTTEALFAEIKAKTESIGLKTIPCPEDTTIKGNIHQYCAAAKGDLKTVAAQIEEVLGQGWSYDMPWRTDYGATASSFKLDAQPNLVVGFDYVPKTMTVVEGFEPLKDYDAMVAVIVEDDSEDKTAPGT